jgi:AraC-like DNA-binding protein
MHDIVRARHVDVRRHSGPPGAQPSGNRARHDETTGACGFRWFDPSPALSDVVEHIWDWDVPDAVTAARFTVRISPSANPLLVLRYRVPAAADWEFGSDRARHPMHRNVAVKLQTGMITLRPLGPIGKLVVALRPETVHRLTAVPMREFLDTKIELHDLFGARAVVLLDEALMEAADSTQRVRVAEQFLLRYVRPAQRMTLLEHAASKLRFDPSLPVRRLASQLDISERHLSRGFNAVYGMSPKHFARLARIENAIAERRRGAAWVDVAGSCGFFDQAHLIHDFNAIIGVPPQDISSSLAADGNRRTSVSGTPGFFNIFRSESDVH